MKYIPCQLLFKAWRYFMMSCSGVSDQQTLACADTSYMLSLYFFGSDVSRHCRERFRIAVEEYKNNVHNRKKAWLLFNRNLSHIMDYELTKYGIHRADPVEIIKSLYSTTDTLGL